MSDTPWLAWTVVAPLAGGVLSLLVTTRAIFVAAIASLATIASSAQVVWQVWTRGVVRHAVGGWSAPLGITLRADGLGALLLATFGVVGLLVSLHAAVLLGARKRAERFLALWLFAWAALDALALSADVFNLYVTLELTTLTAVGLIALERAPAALTAGLRYLLLALIGSLFYLTGVALLYGATSTLDLELLRARLSREPAAWAALALMTSGLSLKAGLFPLHAWIPPAYANAPATVSAILSALIGKAPWIVLVRVWLEATPPALHGRSAPLFGVLGAGAIVWGSLLAIRARRLKRVLAYSSLAHVGYLFLLFTLDGPLALRGAVYMAVSHAAASAAMFTAAGIVERSVGHDDMQALKGLAHRRPVTFFALGLAGTSLMGLPPSGGFVAKWLLARAALEQGQWWWAVVVVGGGLLGAAYVLPIWRGSFLPLPHGLELHDVPRATETVSLTLAVIAVALGVAPTAPLALLAVGRLP